MFAPPTAKPGCPGSNILVNGVQMSDFKILLQFMRPFKATFTKVLIATVTVSIISMTPPLIMKGIIDEVIGNNRADLYTILLSMFIALPLVVAIMRMVNHVMISKMANKLVFNIRSFLYRHLQYLPIRYYDKTSTGMVMERLMGDVNQVQSILTGQTINLVCDAARCIFALGVMFIINWRLSFIMLAILPLYALNYRFFISRIRSSNEDYRLAMENLSGTLQERLAGTAIIKAYGKERTEERMLLGEAFDTQNSHMQCVVNNSLFGAAAQAIYWMGHSGTFLLGCYLVIDNQMTLGDVLAFTACAVNLLGPVIAFTQISTIYTQTMVSVRRIVNLLNESREDEDTDNAVEAGRLKGHVQFDHVWFEYEKNSPVVKDFCLDVEPGQTVAFVGHTGCGKTTITSLLYRFYDPVQGRILVDGVDSRDYSRNSFRRNLGIVPQDPVLFEGSVRDNIRYGRPGATDEEVIEAARIAEMHQAISELPDGYDTILGEEGAKLSVGQKQRIVIARAVLADPAILILDEATSALDTESERLIQNAMTRVMEGRTCFVVAHRLSTIVNADKIVVMSEGKILEAGSHRELMNLPTGHYRQLYVTQFAASTAHT